ncbi:zinc metallopeptidase [Mesorhizobium xinjiangense]|uniref:zinc metallopeptidase n=1 Tax=Mesorhizobium xinjiangense TaxID=2678685 RepID=UPI0012ECE4B5|nr:zinc metallopeptidase [Mesorhizobium xinjiangense]
MLVVLGIAALLAAVILPQLWVSHTIARHGRDRPDLPGSGGELARHLLDRFGLDHVAVETSQNGDHYDPDARAVRLLPAHHDGRSISAAAIAAHEVSHAVQHARGERLLAARQSLARIALASDRLAGIFFVAAPVLAIIARTPMAFVAIVAAGVALLGVRVLVSLLTLPVEIDASFGKALPILDDGRYLKASDMPAARSVLRAAALTYVAGALMSLVNLARWARLLR